MSHVRMRYFVRTNESCRTYQRVMTHTWMRHITYYMSHLGTRYVARMDASCCMCEWVMSNVLTSHDAHRIESCRAYVAHMNAPHLHIRHSHLILRYITRMYVSFRICERVMSNILTLSHVAHMNTSCHNCAWVKSDEYMSLLPHVEMSRVTHMNESWHTYEWVMAHIWMGHGTHMNESWHTYEWVMAHIWMGNVIRMNESFHEFEWGMSHLWMRHVKHEWVTSHL